jgi:exodeoxyribonuclease VII large subunit
MHGLLKKTASFLLPQEPISVSDLNKRIKRLFEDQFENIWVKGEVADVRRQANGMLYFTLKEDVTDKKGSQISAVLFTREAISLTFDLVEGMSVLALCRVNVFEARGTYQLVVNYLSKDGQGQLQAAFEALKQKLQLEGLFDSNRKRPIPQFIRTVAFITSPTGAVIHDFTSILKRYNWKGRLILLSAQVQGEKAPASLIQQIEAVSQLLGTVDLVVIGRGGGSSEDLNCFNDERLLRVLAQCPIPTISAIGHESDFTLCDLIADFKAETPSAAAELIVKNTLSCLKRYDNAFFRLTDHYRQQLKFFKQALISYSRYLKPYLLERNLHDLRLYLSDLYERLGYVVSRKFEVYHKSYAVLDHKMKSPAFAHKLIGYHKALGYIHLQFNKAFEEHFRKAETNLSFYQLRLNNCSLDATLKRGFAVIKTEDGAFVGSKKEAQGHSAIRIVFADGILHTATHKI